MKYTISAIAVAALLVLTVALSPPSVGNFDVVKRQNGQATNMTLYGATLASNSTANQTFELDAGVAGGGYFTFSYHGTPIVTLNANNNSWAIVDRVNGNNLIFYNYVTGLFTLSPGLSSLTVTNLTLANLAGSGNYVFVDSSGNLQRTNAGSAGFTNTLAAGWKTALTTNGATVSISHTNPVTSLASNVATAQIDFSDAGTPVYEVTNLNTALTLQLTNLVYGRDVWVYIRTDGTARNITVVTNGITTGTRISWGINSITNGGTAFTATNRARINFAAIPKGEVAAAYEYQQ